MSNIVESPDLLEPVETEEWEAGRSKDAIDRGRLEQRPLHLRDVPVIVQREIKMEAAKRGLRMGQMVELAWLFFGDNLEEFDEWQRTTHMTPEP